MRDPTSSAIALLKRIAFPLILLSLSMSAFAQLPFTPLGNTENVKRERYVTVDLNGYPMTINAPIEDDANVSEGLIYLQLYTPEVNGQPSRSAQYRRVYLPLPSSDVDQIAKDIRLTPGEIRVSYILKAADVHSTDVFSGDHCSVSEYEPLTFVCHGDQLSDLGTQVSSLLMNLPGGVHGKWDFEENAGLPPQPEIVQGRIKAAKEHLDLEVSKMIKPKQPDKTTLGTH